MRPVFDYLRHALLRANVTTVVHLRRSHRRDNRHRNSRHSAQIHENEENFAAKLEVKNKNLSKKKCKKLELSDKFRIEFTVLKSQFKVLQVKLISDNYKAKSISMFL
ncbi:hypothetical protein PUN28_007446 [Cardiocondyla obscurior]|uniref:Uncharacterized protein n=1 Tax=Cardiocondyla obscurior TaxID=286306 RepID=A0AAW2G6Z9_9HYME